MSSKVNPVTKKSLEDSEATATTKTQMLPILSEDESKLGRTEASGKADKVPRPILPVVSTTGTVGTPRTPATGTVGTPRTLETEKPRTRKAAGTPRTSAATRTLETAGTVGTPRTSATEKPRTRKAAGTPRTSAATRTLETAGTVGTPRTPATEKPRTRKAAGSTTATGTPRTPASETGKPVAKPRTRKAAVLTRIDEVGIFLGENFYNALLQPFNNISYARNEIQIDNLLRKQITFLVKKIISTSLIKGIDAVFADVKELEELNRRSKTVTNPFVFNTVSNMVPPSINGETLGYIAKTVQFILTEILDRIIIDKQRSNILDITDYYNMISDNKDLITVIKNII
jgi:hypothetical protein